MRALFSLHHPTLKIASPIQRNSQLNSQENRQLNSRSVATTEWILWRFKQSSAHLHVISKRSSALASVDDAIGLVCHLPSAVTRVPLFILFFPCNESHFIPFSMFVMNAVHLGLRFS
jgi:hypothetical protein